MKLSATEISNYSQILNNLFKNLDTPEAAMDFSKFLKSQLQNEPELSPDLDLITLTKHLTDLSLLNKETATIDYDNEFFSNLNPAQTKHFYSIMYELHHSLTHFLNLNSFHEL